MISEEFKDIFYKPINKLVTSKDDVVTLNEDDKLLHAMIVLSNSGYQTIPVLNKKNNVTGIISIAMIVTSCEDYNGYKNDSLTKKVKTVMKKSVSCVNENFELEDILKLLIDNNFLCVVNNKNEFVGMIKRKEILERFTFIAHKVKDIKLK
ncbi:MAG: cyclic-di-AMP-binding protein CbpB [Peptoniphilaceae bacterium]|nr:CBS domain-containing protein [Peptoniphilaceae bacterium]MDD7382822.1 CBS domain-containing protein [Peptoniphilaceae bacterium]MDY3738219.1 cyclic-di-AMP-binding protein CbpB [Peptoniphilaceae bacterium]